ncbi:MAG: hypothetical protein KF866_03670 [Phycisphaeraceae bacterium]|nr:hypothetical protein [Phycisphaeraceae bacterium]MCW5753208.1 hypothetical protein [Phycisphaeraceae bacterium]
MSGHYRRKHSWCRGIFAACALVVAGGYSPGAAMSPIAANVAEPGWSDPGYYDEDVMWDNFLYWMAKQLCLIVNCTNMSSAIAEPTGVNAEQCARQFIEDYLAFGLKEDLTHQQMLQGLSDIETLEDHLALGRGTLTEQTAWELEWVLADAHLMLSLQLGGGQ